MSAQYHVYNWSEYNAELNQRAVVSNEGLILTPTTTLAECPPLDVICVPGGGIGQVEVMQDAEILDFLRQQSITAQYVTSVCTGH